MERVCAKRVVGRWEKALVVEGDEGRRFVLKRVEEHCLLNGQLHPSVRARLQRVREVAVGGVANLWGVEQEGEAVYLVWEFVHGRTVEEAASGKEAAEEQRLLQECARVLRGLHAHGLVHGAAHRRNFFVDPLGRVRLTHVSPLLHVEEKEDWAALWGTREDAGASGSEPVNHKLRWRARAAVVGTLVGAIACACVILKWAVY